MAYTRPPSNSADASWLAAPAFTRPASNTADAVFLDANTAVGFSSTSFGAPANLFRANGFSDTFFSSAVATQFFSASSLGILVQFGTSISRNYFPAQTLGAVTQFGAPTSPSPLTVQATGTTTSRLGIPLAFGYTPPNLAVLGQVFGIAPGKIGTPSAGWLQTGYASGMSLTTFGSPVSARSQQLAGFSSTLFGNSLVRITQRATGFNTTNAGNPVSGLVLQATGVPSGAFGGPVSVRSQQPAGFSSTLFGTYTLKLTQQVSGFNTANAGTPVSGLLLQATSTAPKLRFGQPDVLRSNTFSTYGINASDRFGRPSGFCRFNRFAASFVSGALGTPTCFQRHRVAPASPETRFGQPLLKRAATC